MNWSALINSLAEIEARWKEIADLAIEYSDEKIMILCERKSTALNIHGYLLGKGEDVELLIGSKKKWDKTRRVLVAGVKKGGVGLDDPSLTMLIIEADMKDVRQIKGRLRKLNGTIIDIVDNYSSLERHWDEREKTYRKTGATITVIPRDVKDEDTGKSESLVRRFLKPNTS